MFMEKVFHLVPWDSLQCFKYTWNLHQGDIFLKRTTTVVMKWDFLHLGDFSGAFSLMVFFLECIIIHSTTNSAKLKHDQSKEILSIKYISTWKSFHESREKKLQFGYIMVSWKTLEKGTISVTTFSWKSLLKIYEFIIYTTHAHRLICLRTKVKQETVNRTRVKGKNWPIFLHLNLKRLFHLKFWGKVLVS